MFKLVEENVIQGAKIKVIGIGGGGGNALNTMIHSDLQGVEFIAANTDMQAIDINLSAIKLQLGTTLTSGLGAGANPEIGRSAALESESEIAELLRGADMVFVTAGMGGGTGTGAAPVIARIAKEIGALTVGVVTKPFSFEGKRRGRVADEGLQVLQENVDTLITIPNERLLQIAGQDMSMIDAFKRVDEVLLHAVRGIADLITVNGLINLDFADIRTVMAETGMALMGTGVASGENRAVEAATRAISSPLLENMSMAGATGILINICGSSDLTLFEVNEAAQLIQEEADENANILFGAVVDEANKKQIRVTVIATGFKHSMRFGMRRSSNIRPISNFSRHTDVGNAMEKRNVALGAEQLVQTSENVLALQPVSSETDRKASSTDKASVSQIDMQRLVKEIGFSGAGQDTESDQYDIPTFLRKHAD
jgi:cell division protein FtsZ